MWNARAVIVDKIKNFTLVDEPHMVWNYSGVKKIMLSNLLKLMFKVHDYLAHPNHQIYIQADIRYGYYSVILHSEDQYVFAFTIPGISQL